MTIIAHLFTRVYLTVYSLDHTQHAEVEISQEYYNEICQGFNFYLPSVSVGYKSRQKNHSERILLIIKCVSDESSQRNFFHYCIGTNEGYLYMKETNAGTVKIEKVTFCVKLSTD